MTTKSKIRIVQKNYKSAKCMTNLSYIIELLEI